jgi:hypothetical protein
MVVEAPAKGEVRTISARRVTRVPETASPVLGLAPPFISRPRWLMID